MKSIMVTIIESDTWDSILEFNVVLDNVTNSALGRYLNRCRVTVIDDDVFPSNRFREQLLNDEIEEIFGPSLMLEYFKLTFNDPQMHVDTLKIVILDQLANLYFFLTLYLTMYLVDVVLAPKEEHEKMLERSGGHGHHGHGHGGSEASADNVERRMLLAGIQTAAGFLAGSVNARRMEEDETGIMLTSLIVPHSRRYTAIVIAILYVIPLVFLQIIDVMKCHLSLPGGARKKLQTNLLRKYLYYREEIRLSVNTSQLTMAMVRDIAELVECGYMKVLCVLRIIGKLCLAMVFILAENKLAVLPIVCYPLFLVPYLRWRETITIETEEEKTAMQDEIVQTVNDTVSNYELIQDFHLRPVIVEGCERRVDSFHHHENIARAVVVNNLYLAPWLTTITIGAFIIIGSANVKTVGGTLSLGAFLATINIFKEVGCEIQEIYSEVQEIQKCIGPLQKLAKFMNLETDLHDRLNINRARRREGKVQREAAKRAAVDKTSYAVDTVKIQLKNLSFSYHGGPPVIDNVSQEFEQGKLYAFVGPPGGAKSTFLKLLGQVLLPNGATSQDNSPIFIPPHLRILHAAREVTLLVSSSLMSNILLNDSLEKAGGFERVRRICVRLGFPSRLLAEIDNNNRSTESRFGEPMDLHSHSWATILSHTDFARIKLARVLVSNPECLIFHKPGETFDDFERRHIIGLIRAHVDEKGIELPPELRKYRRPRTVFYTSSSVAGIESADCIFKVSTDAGVMPIEPDKLDDGLMQ
jgi:ABC-type multidrug transport system fused ATPase/permease subunit